MEWTGRGRTGSPGRTPAAAGPASAGGRAGARGALPSRPALSPFATPSGHGPARHARAGPGPAPLPGRPQDRAHRQGRVRDRVQGLLPLHQLDRRRQDPRHRRTRGAARRADQGDRDTA